MKTLEELQHGLYMRAKEDRRAVFNTLHDKLCRKDVLMAAWKAVSANRGAEGIDGETIDGIRRQGIEGYIEELRHELVNGTYRISCVRRVFIPKRNGSMRPLGIPTVRDRIVQQAVRLLLEPIFEADFQDFSFGYRPGRSARQASQEVYKWLNFGSTNIIDIDIDDFFGSIDHGKLLSLVRERVTDRYVLKLIREWLRAGIVHMGETEYPDSGTPQGGVISPLLANIYLNSLDRRWRSMGMDNRAGHDAHMVRYADDIVVLVRGEVAPALSILNRELNELGLRLNEEKSRVTTAQAGFDFLGFHFVRAWSRHMKGRQKTYFFPSRKSVRSFREKIRAATSKRNSNASEETVASRLNAIIVGWCNYFNHSNASSVFSSLQEFVEWSFIKFIRLKHRYRRTGRNPQHFGKLYARYGLKKLSGISYPP